VFKVTITHEFTDEMIDDLITTMVECNDMTASWCLEYDAKGQQVAIAVVRGYDVIFTVDNPEYDANMPRTTENCPTLRKDFDLAVLKKALELCSLLYPQVFRNIVEGNYDANDADVVLQLAIFKEVVYS